MNTVEPIRDMGTVNDIADYLKSQCYRNYVMFVFGIYSGLRISDILRLRVRDVRGKKDVYIREKKTGKEKSFPINPELRPILNEYIKDKADYEYLIKSAKGENTAISRQQAYDILSKAGKKFGISKIGTHTLRKTFGYHMYQQTKDIVTLQQIFNHASVQVTMRYIGLTKDMRDTNMRKLSFKGR